MKQLIFIFIILFTFVFSQNVSAQYPDSDMCVAEIDAIEGKINLVYLQALDRLIQAHRDIIAQSSSAQIKNESKVAISELRTCKFYFEDLVGFINDR